jgi:hypothetical protein
MVQTKLGTKIGMLRFATIRRFNPNGTVRVALDEAAGLGPINEFNAPIPAAWTGPNGEFIGGCPEIGASVVVGQGHGGPWFVIGYVNSNDVFDGNFVSSNNTLMSALRPGRALIQTKKGNRIFADPNIGMQIGNAKEFIHVDPVRGIFSHNIDAEMSFTESSRKINQIVKRDLSDNINRNVLGSALDSQSYDDQLRTICLDPRATISPVTLGGFVRNPPLVENREVVYEFADSFRFTTDEDEGEQYIDPRSAKNQPDINRRHMRSDAFSLSLEHPNHLIETIKGTSVDAFGNILDLNRNPIPIGKDDKTSLRKSADKKDAFARIRELERRSIAYHWELNARKGEEKKDGETLSDIVSLSPPNPKDVSNYSRNRSRFFIDIDKEGQFKINVPSSSETGNIPLLTRYENYSVVLARGLTADGQELNPNEFSKNKERKEIFVSDFANTSSINIDSNNESGLIPNDWIVTDNPTIKFGTAHHDVTKVCNDFTVNANWLASGRVGNGGKENKLLVNDEVHPLNDTVTQLEKIVSDTITTAGSNADGGGRSGVLNFDGWVGANFGANTIDRQSLWVDMAGGYVARLGRDRQNISYASTMDGDCFIEIGGAGVGNTKDGRFSNENDSFRGGTLDIRVLNDAGLSAHFRIDPSGISLYTPGRMLLYAEQDITMKSIRGNINLEAETINMYGETEKRAVNRFPFQQTMS